MINPFSRIVVNTNEYEDEILYVNHVPLVSSDHILEKTYTTSAVC